MAVVWVAAARGCCRGSLSGVSVQDRVSAPLACAINALLHVAYALPLHLQQQKQLSIISLCAQWPADTSTSVDVDQADLECNFVTSTIKLML